LTKKESQFVSRWVNAITNEGIKIFPEDFGDIEKCTEIILPNKTLIIGNELFGAYEILNVDGNHLMHVDSYEKAKYIIYSSLPCREKLAKIKMPVDAKEIKSLLKRYEEYIDSILMKIQNDYKKNFTDEKNSSLLINEIFRILNLARY
jgi:hypothetical protein